MKIIHIAAIRNNSLTGVSVVVPQYIKAEQEDVEAILANIREDAISGINQQYFVHTVKDLDNVININKPIDLVVFNEVYYKEYLYFYKLLKKKRIPYIIIPHGCLTKQAQTKKRIKKIIGNTLFFNRFVNNACSIQCLSEKEFNTTSCHVDKIIGTNGVTLNNRKEIVKKHASNLNFVYIGRLDVYHKGIDIMIEAVSKVKGLFETHQSKVFIYGPNYAGRLEEIEQLIKERHLEEIVITKKEVRGDEKIKALLDADVFIQTSRFEGMPVGLLEALGMGLPCLITEGTNLGDYVRKYNAGIVAENDAISVSEAFTQIFTDWKNFCCRGENGIMLIRDNFTWDKVKEDTLQKYRAIVDSTKRIN